MALIGAAGGGVHAQQPVQTLEVIGTTPLGAELAADKIAGNVQTGTAEQLAAQRAISLAEFMSRNLGSVFVNEAQSNPLQPDVQYRGFVGSPLLGLPQGIAVYQDGVRINEPFGDTVNWALIPESAIDSMYLMPGSNPLFGLNALGGAISIRTKNGFVHPGTSLELHGGSFARAGIELETGGSLDDRLAYFVAASYLEEDGWRDYSPTQASQIFASFGWQSDRTSLDLSLTGADTDLIGNGPAPIELLELSREAIFTRPDRTQNRMTLLNVSLTHDMSDTLTLNGNAYARRSDVDTLNGDDSDLEECPSTPGFLCELDAGEETPILDPLGNPVPVDDAFVGATVNRTATSQEATGFGFQASWTADLAGRENLLTVGLAYDRSDVGFRASSELGALDATRLAVPGSVFNGDAFTALDADVANAGIYVSNVFSLTDALSLTLSGRYNRAEIELRDRIGTALSGDHVFERFNPAIGLTFAMSDRLTFYLSLTESSRAPSPVELTCADEDDPCRLPNAFLSDPPLEDVVAKTAEVGLRGGRGELQWRASVFRATNEDDILFISAGALTSEGFFDNVGRTRRDGIELGIDGLRGRISWFANLTYLDASFREPFRVASVNHPLAVDGEIEVEPGDRLPLIPSWFAKAGFEIESGGRWTFGLNAGLTAGVYYRGDEGNLAAKTDAYTLLSARADYELNDRFHLFINVDNVLDSRYETFGLFGEADEVLGEDFADRRFLSPGAPRAAWIGVRVQL